MSWYLFMSVDLCFRLSQTYSLIQSHNFCVEGVGCASASHPRGTRAHQNLLDAYIEMHEMEQHDENHSSKFLPGKIIMPVAGYHSKSRDQVSTRNRSYEMGDIVKGMPKTNFQPRSNQHPSQHINTHNYHPCPFPTDQSFPFYFLWKGARILALSLSATLTPEWPSARACAAAFFS